MVSQLCGSIFDCILPHFQRPLTGVLSEHWSPAGSVRHRFNRCSAALELVVVVVVVSPRSAGDHVDASSKSSGEAKSISHAASLAEPAAAPAVVHVQSRRLALVACRPESRSESGSESGSKSGQSQGWSPGRIPGRKSGSVSGQSPSQSPRVGVQVRVRVRIHTRIWTRNRIRMHGALSALAERLDEKSNATSSSAL